MSIVIEDGIIPAEAGILGSEYFYRYVSGCGIVGTPEDHGNSWVLPVYLGYGGLPMDEALTIHKQSGTISMAGYPTLTQPLEEWGIHEESGTDCDPLKKHNVISEHKKSKEEKSDHTADQF